MKKDPIIYEPKGRALEYAPLACNLAIGCIYGCKYPCYGPAQFRRDPATWEEVRPKVDAIARFERDAARLAGDPREILFSFSTDPCGTPAQVEMLGRALEIAERHQLRVTVLTKNPQAAAPFFEQFARCGWRLGTTACFISESLREEWEPGAPPVADRLLALSRARRSGVGTWMSVEPIVDVEEALRLIATVLPCGMPCCDEIRVGHWNHDVRAKEIDWRMFLDRARALLRDHPHLFKADLLKAAKEGA